MSRDQGAATGQQPYEPGRCECGCLETFHKLTDNGTRAGCSNSNCGCRRYAAAIEPVNLHRPTDRFNAEAAPPGTIVAVDRRLIRRRPTATIGLPWKERGGTRYSSAEVQALVNAGGAGVTVCPTCTRGAACIAHDEFVAAAGGGDHG